MAFEDDIRNLARNPTLAALEPEALRSLARGATPRSLRAGDILFCRDEPSEGGYFLRAGAIALEQTDYREPHIVRPPALIGDMALIAPTRRPATAVACETSEVLEIPRTLFQSVLCDSPRSAERLRRVVEKRLRSFVAQLDELREKISEPLEER